MRPGRPYAGRPPEESPSPARARGSAFGARGSARKKGLGTRGSGLGYAHPEPRVPNPEPLDGSSGPVNHALLFERRLSCGETGDGHAERRAGHVGHAHTVTEFHRRGLATVLPTDADLELGPRSPAELDRQLDEFADAFLVEHLERVVPQDAVLHVEREEPAGVV